MVCKHSLVIIIIAVCASFQLCFAATDGAVNLDTGSIVQASRLLADEINTAVRLANGDAQTHNIHLVLAFSTGHFASDPVKAMAGRAIARLLVERYVVAGDSVSVYAWEQGLWNNHLATDATVAITDADSARRVVTLFPLTPKTGSGGGHDTENAIVQLSRLPGVGANAVLVLITNDAASISAPGGHVIGQNAPAYVQALTQWRRLCMAGTSGASLQLPIFFFQHTAARERQEDHLDIVLVTPRQFQGPPISGNGRPALSTLHDPQLQLSVKCHGRTAQAAVSGDDLTNVTIQWGDDTTSVHAAGGPVFEHRYQSSGTYNVLATGTTNDGLTLISKPQPVTTGGDGHGFVIVLLVLALGSGLVYLWRRTGAFGIATGPYLLTVCGTQFPLSETQVHAVICQVVGKGYTGPREGSVV
ncbi:MAG TPA: hypothetical protein VHV83_14415, partial [Armatimonadota bacterium]|nr:hypothetical protein [Armatimonadota bacterium]